MSSELTIEAAHLVWLLQHPSYRRIDKKEFLWFRDTADQTKLLPFYNLERHLLPELFNYIWQRNGYCYASYAAKHFVCQFSLVSQQQAMRYLSNGSTTQKS